MKSRLSYFLISGIIILSILTGAISWHYKHLNQIPEFNKKSFSAPISSKYKPSNADLILLGPGKFSADYMINELVKKKSIKLNFFLNQNLIPMPFDKSSFEQKMKPSSHKSKTKKSLSYPFSNFLSTY